MLFRSHAAHLGHEANTESLVSRAGISYSPRSSRETDQNILAKQLGLPHSQDTMNGPGRPKSLPQIGLSRLSNAACDDEVLSARGGRTG